MRSTSVFLGALCAAVLIAVPVYGQSIVWVTEDTGATPDTDPPVLGYDMTFQDLLTDAGYDVTRLVDVVELHDENATEFGIMEAADLVIVSRDTNSGNYNAVDDTLGIDEPTTWNSISTPMIQVSSYLVRSNRWLWFVNTGTPTSPEGVKLEPVVADHAIFDGVALDENGTVVAHDPDAYPDEADVINLTNQQDAGNGEVLAVDPETENVWIAHFEAGTEFYEGAGQTPAGNRLWFAGGSNQDATSKGGLNYTEEVQQMFLNATAWMINPDGETDPVLGDVNLDGVVNGLDVDPFVSLVTGGTYQAEGDMNGDGVVNGLDVDPFVAEVVGGGIAAVPEPSTLLLTLAALSILAIWRRRR